MKTLNIDGVEYAPVQESDTKINLVRTDRAGIHVGEIVDIDGQTVKLKNARRIWRWRGANTLNDVVTTGIDNDWSRVSEPVHEVMLLDAIEILPVSAYAVDSLTTSRWPL